MKQAILMRHKHGWLEGVLEQFGNWAVITNRQGNRLYSGSAALLDSQFANGNIKPDEGREKALAKLFGEPTA